MHRAIRAGLLLFALALAGCSKSGPEKFIPSEGQARQALETALAAWKNGQEKPGKLSLGKVGIEVVDANWSAGQKLTAFEIVSEEPGEGPRFFTVKLTLAKAKGPETVKYVVLGNDPLWVYTEAAYNKLSGSWGAHARAARSDPPPAGRRAGRLRPKFGQALHPGRGGRPDGAGDRAGVVAARGAARGGGGDCGAVGPL